MAKDEINHLAGVSARRVGRLQRPAADKRRIQLDIETDAGGQLTSLLNLAMFILLLIFINGVLLYSHNAVKGQVFINGHVQLIDQMSLLSQQMPGLALDASIGRAGAFDDLDAKANAFSLNLLTLRQGRDDPDMPAALRRLNPQLDAVGEAWARVREDIATVVDGNEEITAVLERSESLYSAVPELQALMDEVVGLMVAGGEPASQIYFASLQLTYAERIALHLEVALHGEVGSATAANEFVRWTGAFRENLDRMLGRETSATQKPVADPVARALLEEIDSTFSTYEADIPLILEGVSRFFQVRDTASRTIGESQEVLKTLEALADGYRVHANPGAISDGQFVYTGAIVLTVLLTMLFLPTLIGLRRRVVGAAKLQRETMLQSQTQNMAVLQLLDEIEPLQDGDLTVEASVDEAFTGTIADAINSSIETLRRLVSTINETSARLSGTAQATARTTNTLAAASEQQAKDIGSAAQSITVMAQSMESMSGEAKRSAEVAKSSVDLARRGGEAVRTTIQGMDGIREQIQETAKRIKRLGESSQEIGEIVGLIDDIADQTNILALNAAIQASSAGEAGRGFAVVADEVQRLAERSANATKQIGELVSTIQNDTNDAVTSMERTTTEVVAGAQRAEGAGAALDEIENVSSELAQLIDNISRATSKHAEGTVGISKSMMAIEDVTRRTSTGAGKTAESIGELATVAENLKQQVSGFRLPSAGV